MDRLRSFYGPDSFQWFSTTYVADWLVAALFWVAGEFIDHTGPWERDFSVDDPVINHPHTKQQINGTTNNYIALLTPLCIFAVFSVKNKSLILLHHGALGLWVSRSMTHVITEALKNRVGRLRPDFLARCKWGEALQQCTGNFGDILDGRRSFPSGHSSTIFSGMTFLSLFLAGQTAAWSFTTPLPSGQPWAFQSRLLRITITLLPLAFAIWVAISRVEDYRHHKDDVIVGSLIGIFTSFVGYLSYWRSPFSSRLHARGLAHTPRLLYKEDVDDENQRAEIFENYELSRLEQGIE